MKCPKCGREMEPGYLTAGGYRILWTDRERRWSNLRGARDVLLQGMTLTGKNRVSAWICRDCRRVVAEYE